MGLIRLNVLGAPEVYHDGCRLTFSLRKAQALLLYLAVEGGMHSRSKLAAFLWPDSEPHAARTGLRTTLTLLRGLFADSDASPSQHSHLLSEHELLGLNPRTPLELDLDVVQQAYQALRLSAVPSEQQRAALAALFQHALSLVRGPFLDGQPRESPGPFLPQHGGDSTIKRTGGPSGRTGRGFHSVGRELSASAAGAVAGRAGGGRGRHR